MLTISICRTVSKHGSILTAHCLETIYREEVPKNIDELVEAAGGDFYDVEA